MISRVSGIITAGLDIDELLQRAADAIHELLGYNNIAIPLIDRDDPETLVIRAVGGEYKKLIRSEWRFPTNMGVMGSAVRERRIQIVDDVSADPRYVVTPGAVGIRAEVAVPVIHADEVLGVLNVESEKPFTAEDAESLQIVADHLAVAINNARLFERAQQLVVVEERQRLARELHDSVTQTLASVSFLAQSLPAAWEHDAGVGAEQTRRLVDLTRAALAEMRSLLHELRPSGSRPYMTVVEPRVASIELVRNEGVVAALKHLAVQMSGEETSVAIDASRYERQPLPAEETIFRIAQEALGNVLRHAHAEAVTITLEQCSQTIRLTVEDDGDGFDVDAVSAGNRGFGLRHMNERAGAIGGRLTIAARQPHGTAVRLEIPPSPRTAAN